MFKMQTLYIHPENPQPRLIQQVARALNEDKLVIYPTDTSYAFACKIGSKNALSRLKLIRGLDDKHQFTLLCRDLSEIASYASVSNRQYRVLKANTPARITFILNATKDVPKKLAHPKKRTIGIRIPKNPISQALLEELNEPILTSSLILADAEQALDDPFDIEDKLDNQVDILVNAGLKTTKHTTIIDMTDDEISVLREGEVAVEDLVL